jgi:peroxiredoxin
MVLFGLAAPARSDEAPAAKIATATVATVGQKAPDFTLLDATGKKRTLSEFQGKYVVLEWVNFDCPFVRKHYGTKNMQGLQARYTNQDVVWLSICSSAPGKQGYFAGDELKKRIEAEGLKSTAYLIDADGAVGKRYEAKSTPSLYVINPAGVLIYAGAIDDHPSTNPDDVAGSKNYVVEALTAAQSGRPVATSWTKSYGCSVKYAD